MPRVLATACIVALTLLFGLNLKPAWGIEELEAEEDIAELLPEVFPVRESGNGSRGRQWAILPEFGYGPETGVLGGVKFAHRNLYGLGTRLDTEAQYAMNRQQSFAVSIGSPHLANDRLLLLLRAKYYMDPQREFFGLGNNDLSKDPDLPSTHRFQDLGGAITLGWRPFNRVAFNFAIGLRKVNIGHGPPKDNRPFTQDEFPALPGIHGGVVNPLALSLVWNSRDDVIRPTHGWRIILKVIHTNKALLSDFEFTRYVLDAGYLHSFSEGRQVLGIRVDGEYVAAPADEVPFWELAELGGQDTLRGFFPHRFLGKGRALLNAEFRSRITAFNFYDLWRVRLDGVVFGDAGRVFLDHSDVSREFHLNRDIFERIVSDFQYSYGAGVRFALSEALVARIDIGFSREETGLVYLSFGQTF
jgi:outer membrane protein assembly factor BamA